MSMVYIQSDINRARKKSPIEIVSYTDQFCYFCRIFCRIDDGSFSHMDYIILFHWTERESENTDRESENVLTADLMHLKNRKMDYDQTLIL